jgi:hypothetical protein
VCTGLSGEPTVGRANGRPRNLRGTRGGANGRKKAPDCPVCTGHVRCANGSQISVGLQRSAAPVKETNRAPDSVRRAPDCPVPPSTEGKDGLLNLLSTAPSCLGAIKRAPRRMEETHKQLLSILDHPHLVFAHSFVILRDSSSVLVRAPFKCRLRIGTSTTVGRAYRPAKPQRLNPNVIVTKLSGDTKTRDFSIVSCWPISLWCYGM